MKTQAIFLAATLLLHACNGHQRTINKNTEKDMIPKDSTMQYGYNRDFLRKHTGILELKNGSSAIVIVPQWQGRVMTSTAGGDHGFSFGWINHDLITSGVVQEHINAYGGEERLWLGPEGGQFSIFFDKGKTFTYDNWQTPAFIDTEPFEVISSTDTMTILERHVAIDNYSGTNFRFKIERKISLLQKSEISDLFSVDPGELDCVAYESENILTNEGDQTWNKHSGMLSIWMLGMFIPSPSVVIVIPVKPGDESTMGPKVNDNYFGRISADRLKISGDHVYLRADGMKRGKIGIPPARATGKMGSYDAEHNILTLLICRMPDKQQEYVNSAWEMQEDPYSGDALNAYNDGPLDDGSQMGPFYELETSSPAADLSPGESLSHTQYTLHLTGNLNGLDNVCRKVLGISLEEIRSVF
jgi:hypothetical protein